MAMETTKMAGGSQVANAATSSLKLSTPNLASTSSAKPTGLSAPAVPKPSSTSALDAASGHQDLDSITMKDEGGPPKIDANELTKDIGNSEAVNTGDEFLKSQEDMANNTAMGAGTSQKGLSTFFKIGSAVAGIASLVLMFIAPPIGAIVGLGALGLGKLGDSFARKSEANVQVETKKQKEQLNLVSQLVQKKDQSNFLMDHALNKDGQKQSNSQQTVTSTAAAGSNSAVSGSAKATLDVMKSQDGTV